MAKKRAMTTGQASRVKLAGHARERHFAELIGGEVNKGTQTDKKDVIDQQHRFHSVKGGTWWQIFLYGRARFESNTIFQNIGSIADLMIACIDAFPPGRSSYVGNKGKYKSALQGPMGRLAQEFGDVRVKKAFFMKSLFNGGEVNYLTVQPKDSNEFFVFTNNDVVDCLSGFMEVGNSRARRAGEYDNQKVLFRIEGRNAGEIEIRTDSDTHYRQAKCRLNAPMVFSLLKEKIGGCREKASGVFACGQAGKLFRVK